MSGIQYLKNQLPVILINLLGVSALALFLMNSGSNAQSVLFIIVIWVLVVISYFSAAFLSRKKYLDRLLNITENLEQKYLIAEAMETPEKADYQVFHRI